MSWNSIKEHSYVPYSGKKSACITESKSGKYFAGVRVENISYPLTIPAVQAACAICLSEGEIPAKIYVEDTTIDQLDFWVKEFGLEVIETETPPIGNLETLFHTTESKTDSLTILKELLRKAVTPNSDFPVSALLFVDGGFFEGVNVEISEWSLGICAERVALAKAVAAGINDFRKLEIHTKKGEVSSPCGACRQVISELLPYHNITLHHADGTLSEHLSVDLLPFSFKSSALKK
ncbi:MAG: cytidine deaminase [Gracilimonas sp.]